MKCYVQHSAPENEKWGETQLQSKYLINAKNIRADIRYD